MSSGLFSRLILEDFCLNCEKTCLGFRVSHVSSRIMSAGIRRGCGRYGRWWGIGDFLRGESTKFVVIIFRTRALLSGTPFDVFQTTLDEILVFPHE